MRVAFFYDINCHAGDFWNALDVGRRRGGGRTGMCSEESEEEDKIEKKSYTQKEGRGEKENIDEKKGQNKTKRKKRDETKKKINDK